MRKLGCETLPSNYLGTCGKNGINLCVDDVKKMIVKNTGKAVPKGYGVRCDKCIDEAPKPEITEQGSQEDDVSERRTLVLCFSRIKGRIHLQISEPNHALRNQSPRSQSFNETVFFLG
ncbi:unnamed protein product [Brassica oleracea var. botrytis]|uniref:(rape) hypothetical protein n=1 Tax=Brassica napus TaxID=3708 RepID=A0A816I535_BRANA|nr:unnamed protein product [Brassica napus]